MRFYRFKAIPFFFVLIFLLATSPCACLAEASQEKQKDSHSCCPDTEKQETNQTSCCGDMLCNASYMEIFTINDYSESKADQELISYSVPSANIFLGLRNYIQARAPDDTNLLSSISNLLIQYCRFLI